MSNSKNFIPRRGKNPAALEAALAAKNSAMLKSMASLDGLAKMVASNCSILGQLVVMFELLKDKGIITNDEIKAKFKELEAKREAEARAKLDEERRSIAHPDEPDGDSEDPKGGVVQPEESGSDEGASGHGGLRVL